MSVSSSLYIFANDAYSTVYEYSDYSTKHILNVVHKSHDNQILCIRF